MTREHIYDVLIIGSGAAGLSLALQLPPHKRVAVLSKGDLTSGSSWLAQGGIAAAMDNTDTARAHFTDTMMAGGNLSREAAVEYTVSHARESIQWLIKQGVPFTREESRYHLTKEGGHSHRRIIHAADATGQAVQQTLIDRSRAARNIDIFESYIAVDLITRRKIRLPINRCLGAYVLDTKTAKVNLFRAAHVVLATGGASKAYLYTSNSDGASGDGIAMAWRAGCRVANMEFNQFHPTNLYHPQVKSFLISEAVRGEGGVCCGPTAADLCQALMRAKSLRPGISSPAPSIMK